MKNVARIFETGPDRYQTDLKYTYHNDPEYTLDQRILASLVGLAAIGMPAILFIGSVMGTCFYDSISHYYYAQFLGGFFIAILVFIATFLVAYRGGNDKESLLATLAGISALGVALFPTKGRGCELSSFSGRALADFTLEPNETFVTVVDATKGNSYFELFSFAGVLHFLCAAVLFAFLAWYTLKVFTRDEPEKHRVGRTKDGTLKPLKKARNDFYILAGRAIIGCMVIIAANFAYEYFSNSHFKVWYDYNFTFWLEAIALWAFGFSWVIKGRLFGTLQLDDVETPS